jgi:Ca2+-binding EF-hand superfamily protein
VSQGNLDVSFLLGRVCTRNAFFSQFITQCKPVSHTHSFGQTLFSRFVKEMVLATDTNHDGKISMQEMKNMLKRIGVDQLVSDGDLTAFFDEIGHKEDTGETLIYVDEVESILMQPSEHL